MPKIHFRDGGVWKDATVKKRSNSAWVDADVFVYEGGKWNNATKQTITKTWTSIWSRSYQGDGTKRADSQYGNTRMYQGEYNDAWNSWGLQRSMMAFNMTAIRADLSGAEIKDVKLYLKNYHWYFSSGGTAVIGLHNSMSEPTTFQQTYYSWKQEFFSGRGQSKWVDIGEQIGRTMRDGNHSGFTLMSQHSNHKYYGYFYGADSAYAPKLQITYVK